MEFTDVNETFLNKFTVLDGGMGAGKTYNVAELSEVPGEGCRP
jgi:predicted ATPase